MDKEEWPRRPRSAQCQLATIAVHGARIVLCQALVPRKIHVYRGHAQRSGRSASASPFEELQRQQHQRRCHHSKLLEKGAPTRDQRRTFEARRTAPCCKANADSAFLFCSNHGTRGTSASTTSRRRKRQAQDSRYARKSRTTSCPTSCPTSIARHAEAEAQSQTTSSQGPTHANLVGQLLLQEQRRSYRNQSTTQRPINSSIIPAYT